MRVAGNDGNEEGARLDLLSDRLIPHLPASQVEPDLDAWARSAWRAATISFRANSWSIRAMPVLHRRYNSAPREVLRKREPMAKLLMRKQSYKRAYLRVRFGADS